jgi:hypothetical protein
LACRIYLLHCLCRIGLGIHALKDPGENKDNKGEGKKSPGRESRAVLAQNGDSSHGKKAKKGVAS